MNTTAEPGVIVLLNGVGSAGKSSIARALQAIASRPFLHVQMDSFLKMLPPSYLDHDDGLKFCNAGTPGQPSIEIATGPVALRLLLGMRHAIAALARQGNDLIVDDVLFDGDAQDYRSTLAGLTVHWVGVMASLDVLEAREKARGDRLIGLARWQFSRMHGGIDYDLSIDTGRSSAEDAAQLIKQHFAL